MCQFHDNDFPSGLGHNVIFSYANMFKNEQNLVHYGRIGRISIVNGEKRINLSSVRRAPV